MKAIVEGIFSLFEKVRNIDIDSFLNDARKRVEEVSENPTRFAFQTVLQLKLVYEMVECYLKKECSFPWKTALALVGLLLYLVNPLDVIPDFIPGIGYLDDMAVIGVALKFIRDDLKAFALSKGFNLSDYGLD